jgi:hypothetical protein
MQIHLFFGAKTSRGSHLQGKLDTVVNDKLERRLTEVLVECCNNAQKSAAKRAQGGQDKEEVAA